MDEINQPNSEPQVPASIPPSEVSRDLALHKAIIEPIQGASLEILAKPKKLEIGVIYKDRKSKKLYLAIHKNKLLTVVKGKDRVSNPKDKLLSVIHVSVDRLCRTWGISLDHLDDLSLKYLKLPKPTQEWFRLPLKKKENKETKDAHWRQMRRNKTSNE